ncbi:Heavy metal-associated isoprenylated plant protein 47 [Hirschfeldia incana]|nr:Heavy metal-associated isoprenylated plant protein 47 [Hirschfeldia incana]
MCIKLSVNCDRCRRKAMEVAANAKGVISVAIEGELEDELVVVGDGIDAACLVDTLRKKACYAILETLEEFNPEILTPDDNQVEPDDDQVEKPQEEDDTDNSNNIETAADDNNGTDQNVPPHCCLAQCSTTSYEHPHPDMYEVVVYDSYGPTTGCIIM